MSTTKQRTATGRTAGVTILGLTAAAITGWVLQGHISSKPLQAPAAQMEVPEPHTAMTSPRIARSDLAARLPITHATTDQPVGDTHVPPIEVMGTTLVVEMGPRLDADTPSVNPGAMTAATIMLGPPLDADDPLGMAQLATTDVITIGETMQVE